MFLKDFSILLVILMTTAHAAPSMITINVKEYGIGNIKPDFLEAMADGSDALVTSTTNDTKVTIPDGTKRLRLKIGAGPIFRERNITLQAAGLTTNRKQAFVLERMRSKFTTEYLHQGLARLERDRDPDAALALFENAFRDTARTNGDVDSYEATLRFNYARALQQACLQLEFDTCDEARDILVAIQESLKTSSSDRSVYESVRIKQALIDRALLDLSSKDVRLKYNKFTAAVASKNFEQAYISIEAIEKADPNALKAARITSTRISTDRAFLRSLSPTD